MICHDGEHRDCRRACEVENRGGTRGAAGRVGVESCSEGGQRRLYIEVAALKRAD